jgi:hypothetical protein
MRREEFEASIPRIKHKSASRQTVDAEEHTEATSASALEGGGSSEGESDGGEQAGHGVLGPVRGCVRGRQHPSRSRFCRKCNRYACLYACVCAQHPLRMQQDLCHAWHWHTEYLEHRCVLRYDHHCPAIGPVTPPRPPLALTDGIDANIHHLPVFYTHETPQFVH